MNDVNRDIVMNAIGNKDAKYMNADGIVSGYATVATVQNVDERKNINGEWINTGHTVTRATIYFEGGFFTRTKSKHVIATIDAIADDPINIDGGFAVVINNKVKFGEETTHDAYGKRYDILTMTIGGE